MKLVGSAVVLGALLPLAPVTNTPSMWRQSSHMAQQSFHVNSVQLTMSPTTLTTWKCGAYVQVVYHATFNVSSGASGGTMRFAWTTTNGRGQTNAQLTILPGQQHTDYTFTWQGALPSDHTQPGVAIVMVAAPNIVRSTGVYPTAGCRV